jgi:chorismate mutase/prephenate dehydratase
VSLPSLRKRIDRLDRQLLRLLSERAALALRVGQLKRRDYLPLFDRRRETAVMRQVMRANRGPLSRASLQKIFREILRQNRSLEGARVRRPTPRRRTGQPRG